MTFYLCMMDTRTQPTSEQGKKASAKPCTTGVVDETLILSLDLPWITNRWTGSLLLSHTVLC